ncbi:hypothetical protein D805_0160 [Bifidobacterium thermophilum RBL67]|uniref:Uncharacterized protein n=1 Tax=Bifidobacterium thermophilum RBL67 TaxID=1254439 RepID=M4RPC5_9BIFI|nr:hypothetical protein D805_0160 [Bifidobacterium thermophilum RBL67]
MSRQVPADSAVVLRLPSGCVCLGMRNLSNALDWKRLGAGFRALCMPLHASRVEC